MKHIISILSIIFAISAHAQNLKDIQKETRAVYAKAMEKIQEQKEEPRIGSIVTIKQPRNYSAVGMCETTTEFFCDVVPSDTEDEIVGSEDLCPYFIRQKFERKESLIGNDYYEYLPHPYTGNLMFYFHKSFIYWCEMEISVETRYYYNADGIFVGGTVQAKDIETGKIVKIDELEPSAEAALEAAQEAQKLTQALDLLVNKKEN